jgi:hypothetical protein
MAFRGAHNKMETKQPRMLKSATNKKLPEAETADRLNSQSSNF